MKCRNAVAHQSSGVGVPIPPIPCHFPRRKSPLDYKFDAPQPLMRIFRRRVATRSAELVKSCSLPTSQTAELRFQLDSGRIICMLLTKLSARLKL